MSRILVVDLDEAVREQACRALTQAGLEADSASERVEVLTKIADLRPDVLLLDLRVTGLDGWGLVERLQAEASAPLIVVAGSASDFADFARNVHKGVAAFIPKPIDYERLGPACRRALGHAKADAETPQEVRDRRREGRRSLMVAVSVEAREDTPALGELRDLSPSGAQVILITPFDVGKRVHVALDPSLVGRSLEFEGEVQWLKELPTGHAHGLTFIDLAPEVASAIGELLQGR